MLFKNQVLALAAVVASSPLASAASYGSKPEPDEDGKYWLHGDGIKAAFIPYGASIANLLINDASGIERDVVTGFDNATAFETDKLHDHFGGNPGRYANRIKNATFEIDGKWYNIKPNEHPDEDHPDGVNVLHGGPNGWDWRNWTVEAYERNTITFSLVDEDGEQGFPGKVVSYVTYTLKGMDWHIKMTATSLTKKTPIMLSSHTYWNLDGFANNETALIYNHTLHLPYSGQRVAVDNILIPTGEILPNKKGSVNDFWSEPKQIGKSFNDPEMLGNCGFNCTGYDNCYTINRQAPFNWLETLPVATLKSDWSGIQLDIWTDQDAFQVYSCGGQKGTTPLKRTQGLFDNEDFPRVIQPYGCLVMEVQDYIDGINHPEWFREKKQIFGPEDGEYVLQAKYSFSVGR